MNITLPWDCLVPDNAKYGVIRGRMVLTRKYRERKDSCHWLAMAQVRPEKPFEGPVRFTAAIYFPDRRKRDAGNYRKIVTDALEGVCYLDDAQIKHETWINGGLDSLGEQAGRLVVTVKAMEAK